MSDFLDHLRQHVLLCDGGMGSLVQALDLSVADDFLGQENCTEILTRSRPDVIRDIHRQYYGAGADVVLSNTFGGSSVTLAEFGLEGETEELNQRAVELAREAADSFADGRKRFVLGDIGPGTKLPSLGHIDYDSLEAGLVRQCDGLIAGGADGILIETCQDPLQFKAAINAAKIARDKAGRWLPILLQVTVETTGTLLVGADIAAAATVAHSLGVDSMGLNCATGPQEMAEHISWLAENWPGLISVQPNAGLPELRDGQTYYPLTPRELADWHRRFVTEYGVNMVGGCCGTTPEHISAVDAMLRELGAPRPAPVERTVHWVPSVASLYNQMPLRQENAFLSIGERCNANGSKKFRDLQEAEDWDAITAMARQQVREGSHTLDVCTAFVGRDEIRDMTEVVSRLRGQVTTPLVIDSTETPVLEAALKLYGGKAILNSINFEDGEETAARRLELARKFGASVIALTIDEEGMAKDAESKLRIARRLYDFAVNQHGLPASDLIFDPLTFTICTGNQDDRRLALETLEAIQRIAEEMPEVQIILGLSNVSFGLKPVARHALNSVFLHHAVKAGMTGAIVHLSKIKPLHKLDPAEVEAAEDLIFDRRREGHDPLSAFIELFQDKTLEAEREAVENLTIEQRLERRIVDGDRQGLEDDLDEALKTIPPLDIINTHLLAGMKVVGELFGSGQMQLPFVLQAAETMKAAVAHLEPHMEKVDGQAKGTLVLATVKGDVHDIGKNLVDIILSNNGYKVVNLGIKQPVTAIIEAAREHDADAVGMSGLLVKSTVIMRENLEEMTRQGLNLPVLLGGAALTRKYVESDCSAAYGEGAVAYARDAFDGLTLMAKVGEGSFVEHCRAAQAKRAWPANAPAGGPPDDGAAPTAAPSAAPSAANENQPGEADRAKGITERPVEWDWPEITARRQDLAAGHQVPEPPFLGATRITDISPRSLVPYISETMLFQFQWGFKKQGRTLAQWKEWARQELRPILADMVARCEAEEILQPAAAYGYYRCASDGDTVVLFEPDGTTELARFSFPRQRRADGLCLADFFRDIRQPERDICALQVVTMGQKASEVARQWFADNRYKDYLYLHGLSVEMAEALAEVTHKRIRAELGFAAEEGPTIEAVLKQHYRGARYSFGYPACPNLEDQARILELLGAEAIGITMSDEDQLHPEQSTSAIVTLHPEAKYFKV
ncbi:methionine synthase [Roseospirillum parvum]|uniref:Methionine synthase n=1 Tax=Roseospirillum parvum TaxID=83401 RepID=A0A1G8C2F0_9PROT|nr:methionine synthase [Roseospirillum parvum]SDH39533.1 5-methyltetrahydrofolate--homocysteine methyltransferase [Roseospirillum parvum]